MKHYLLSEEQKSRTGFSDLFVIPYNDAALTAAVADNTAVAVTLTSLALGDVVKQDVIVEPSVGWTGPSDLTATVSVGVTGTATALTPALTITTGGAATAVSTADTSDNQTNAHYAAAATIAMIATFTPDADSGVDEFTAGELKIWANISRAAARLRVEG